jgi:hypothetical protein
MVSVKELYKREAVPRERRLSRTSVGGDRPVRKLGLRKPMPQLM